MSDAWAMNAGKAATAVGTATIEADDELFTIVGHGLGVGDTVVVDTLTGGASGVLDEGQVYWVVDVTTDTFAVSQHRNGAPVAFSTDGGADVYRFAPQYSAVELRRLDSGLLVNDSGDRFGAREGIHPASDPAISVAGTTWTVENVAGVVYPGLTSTSGPYRFAHPSESGSLDPADGTNDRIDALDLQIQDDDEDASSQRRARVVYTAGTPASSPSAPAQASNSLRLGTILVPSGGSPSPSVSTLAVFTVASGGVLPVRDDTELPSSGTYDGMPAWDQDEGALKVDDGTGSGWDTVASRLVPQQVEFFANGTFDPASYSGAKAAKVMCQGGGGGGAGAPSTTAGEASSGTGGSGGDYAESWFTWDQILTEAGGGTISVTVGSGGSGGAGSGGGTGNTSSFGSLVSASGGAGGGVGSASAGWGGGQPPTANAASTGDLVFKGGTADPTMHNGGEDMAWASSGGSSHCGGGGRGRRSSTSLAGADGGVRGGGGGGASNGNSESAQSGGGGGAGFVAVEVY